jgi:hypothetical protein
MGLPLASLRVSAPWLPPVVSSGRHRDPELHVQIRAVKGTTGLVRTTAARRTPVGLFLGAFHAHQGQETEMSRDPFAAEICFSLCLARLPHQIRCKLSLVGARFSSKLFHLLSVFLCKF